MVAGVVVEESEDCQAAITPVFLFVWKTQVSVHFYFFFFNVPHCGEPDLCVSAHPATPTPNLPGGRDRAGEKTIQDYSEQLPRPAGQPGAVALPLPGAGQGGLPARPPARVPPGGAGLRQPGPAGGGQGRPARQVGHLVKYNLTTHHTESLRTFR